MDIYHSQQMRYLVELECNDETIRNLVALSLITFQFCTKIDTLFQKQYMASKTMGRAYENFVSYFTI